MMGDYPATRILATLGRSNLVPAILFRSARKQCDEDIERLADFRAVQLDTPQRERIQREIDQVCQKYSFDRTVIEAHPHYQALLITGAGAHHAGQLLAWRLLLEELMSRGVMRMLIATGTVAAGVDFPARTVVITSHSKRGNEGFNILTSAEFQQMSGRAGRRGKDAVGFCLVAPSRFCDARVINEVTKKPPEPLRSAYFASPSTVLNLLKFRSIDELRYTVSKSLAAYLDRKHAKVLTTEAQQAEEELASSKLVGQNRKKAEKRVRRKFREAEDLAAHQERALEETLVGLRALGHLDEQGLTPKGLWAAELCTTLVLELAEAVEMDLFYNLGVYELAGLVGSIAGDSHRSYYHLGTNPLPKELFFKMEQAIQRVRTSTSRSVSADLRALPDAALTIITWMSARDWHEFSSLLRLAGVAEGDVARLVTQTADHLNQISKLQESHPDLARMAYDARKLLLKPPLSEAYITD